ncbi:MAG TPA: glycosyltransferase [Thermoguttaceae bacterium]|nr:glycosyltransferase [Thermoguttaceae bacterium]
MRTLHVTYSLDPRTGGPGHVIRHVIREQIRCGCEVALLSTAIQARTSNRPQDEYEKSMFADPDFQGAEIFMGKWYGHRRPWRALSFSPQCHRWLRRRLSDERLAPDVVHIHSIFHYVTTMAAIEARRRCIPYIIEPYGCLDVFPLRQGYAWLKRLFMRWFMCRNLRYAAGIQPASDFEADQVSHWVSRQSIHVIPHGVDVPVFDPVEAARTFRAAFPQIVGRRVILCLGRIHAVKRPELIVEAMALLRRECPDLILLVGGGNSGHLPALQDAVRKHDLEASVVYCGFIEGDLKPGAFAVANLLAQPSAHENFGVSCIEAMAHGVPALVTPEVGSCVHVEKSGGGIVVEGNARAIAQGIRTLLHGDREALGRRGRRYVEQNLSWPVIVGQINDLYRHVVDRNAKARGNGR